MQKTSEQMSHAIFTQPNLRLVHFQSKHTRKKYIQPCISEAHASPNDQSGRAQVTFLDILWCYLHIAVMHAEPPESLKDFS